MGTEYMDVSSGPVIYLDDYLSPECILARWHETVTDLTLEEFALAELNQYMPLAVESRWYWPGPNYRWRDPIAKLELEIAVGLLTQQEAA